MGTTRSLEGYANDKLTFYGGGQGGRKGLKEGVFWSYLSLSGGSKSL